MKTAVEISRGLPADGGGNEDWIKKVATTKKLNYRKAAFDYYEKEKGQAVCTHCGFGIRDVLEVAHLDGDRSNNDLANLAILCPNCHKMYDLDLITFETIILMRDRKKIVNWAKRMKDAGPKAAAKRKHNRDALRRSAIAKKAAAKRKENGQAK